MKQQPGVWGIDLGQCALKALRLQDIDGQLTATAFDYVEYPKILSQPDADPDQLIRDALEQFKSRNPLRGDLVAISVPGQSGLARFVKLPPVEEKKIADIVRFEAKQQIPFNLDEVVWDYQKIGAGSVVDGFALETEIGLFAMKRDLISQRLQHFKDVGIEIHFIQMAPLALCNFVAYDLLGKGPGPDEAGADKPGSVVALDIGADASNLVVTDGGKIIWQRPIPLGGNHFTRALTKDLKLTFAKAEHLKRNAMKSPDLKKILAAIKPVLNDFVGEVQRSLGYFTNTHRDAQIAYMVGLGNAFRLPGIQRFLGEKLQLEVRKLDKLNRLAGDTVTSSPIWTENLPSFGVAYGLAIQGSKLGKITTNLLPAEIRRERLVRAKKPWAAAAAGLLLLGLGATTASEYLADKPYTAPIVADARKASEDQVKRAKTNDDAFAKAKADAKKEEDAVKSIVAGRTERFDWLQLLKFVSDCVPQPDAGKRKPDEPGSIPATQVPAYWTQTPGKAGRPKGSVPVSGQEAFKLYAARQREGGWKPPTGEDGKEVDLLPPGVDDLIQFHIRAVDNRYCDDLKAYWAQVTKDLGLNLAGNVAPAEQAKVVPEGKGWVIEVQGFTYHHAKDAFVRNTLLANIARRGVRTPPPGAAAPGAPAPGAPGAPASGAPAPGAPGAPAAGGEAKAEEPNLGPVVGHISHVVLYNAVAKSITDPGAFEITNAGTLDSLLRPNAGSGGATPGAAPTGAPVGGGMAGMYGGMAGGAPMGGGATGGGADTGPSRDSWINLSSRGGGTGGTAGGGMTGMPGMRPPGMPGAGSSAGPRTGTPMPMPGTPGTPGGTSTSTPSGPHTRTEFIILFIWKEDTPSDNLRGGLGGSSTPGGAPTGAPAGAPK